MPAGELMAFLADEMLAPPGPPAPRAGGARFGGFGRPWARRRVAENRRLLIVDEAHLIEDPATFESLRLLLNFTSGGPPDLAMLLVGAPTSFSSGCPRRWPIAWPRAAWWGR